jgi:regulatory protein
MPAHPRAAAHDAAALGAAGPAADRAWRADPEARLQHARDLAWSALNRRERTCAELARLLAGKRVGPEEIDLVLAELTEQGYLDDAAYARRFAEDRRRLDGWGAERIERRLAALDVDRELIAAAVGEQGHEDELAAALAILGRRFPEPPATPRDRDRALGVLVRKGYHLELAHDALRRHAGIRDEIFD